MNHQHDPNLDPRTCYMRGCREVGCVEANTEYIREWRRSPSGITYRRRVNEKQKQLRAQKMRDQAVTAID